MSLGGYLAALKELHGGRYQAQSKENGVTPFGAYGMLMENWAQWSDEAGLGGASYTDPAAQDSVAGYWATRLFQRYGDWDMVSGAWFAGQDQADKLMREGRSTFRNQRITDFQNAMKESRERNVEAPVPVSARKWTSTTSGGGWINPIAGESEYSGGSWMPNTNTHRGRKHPAMDVYAARGTPVVAPVTGKVVVDVIDRPGASQSNVILGLPPIAT